MHIAAGDDGGAGGGGLSKQQRVLLDAFAGAAAGCMSRVIVAPLDLVKIRLQVQLEPVLGASAVSKYTGFTHAITTVLREEGVLVGCGRERSSQPTSTNAWLVQQAHALCMLVPRAGRCCGRREARAQLGGSPQRARRCAARQKPPATRAGPVARHRAGPAADGAVHRRPVRGAAAGQGGRRPARVGAARRPVVVGGVPRQRGGRGGGGDGGLLPL
jgi:hypothetical protein